MPKFLAAFNGYKSYLVAFATIIYGAVEWATGAMTQDQAMAFIFTGTGLAALRHGVSGSVITIAQQLLPAVLQAVQSAQAPAAAPSGVSPAAKVSAIIVAAILGSGVLVGCALPQPAAGTTPAQAAAMTAEEQLTVTCNTIGATYRTATAARLAGKLSAGQLALLTDAEPTARATCDPTHPPTDATASLALATAALAKAADAIAGVK